MAYGTIKIDTITFTDGGIDKSVSISGLVQNPTFTGNITVTGTVSGNTVRGQTISGVTITGTTAQFTSGTFVSLTGTTLQGTTATYTTGSFTSLTGTTTSGTTANFVSGVFSTQISGVTVTGTTANFTSGNFTNISGGTHTITSGVFAAGTAANPSISFTSDPNTGIYSPGADQVAISTNGTGRLFVGSTGNVGVGTASPGGKLVISDGSTTFQFDPVGGTGNILRSLTSGGSRDALLFDASQYVYSNGATEYARIDSSGRLLVGTSTARSNFFNTTLTAGLQVEGTGGSTARGALSIVNNDSSDNPTLLILGRSGAATLGSNSVLSNNSWIGTLSFQGADGTELVEAANITAYVDGTPGANDMPGRLVFSTTADGASTPTERMRIGSSGQIDIGNTTNGAYTVTRNTGVTAYFDRRGSDGTTIQFERDGSGVGTISVTTTATAYNTSSDYRLKESVVPLTGAIDRVNQLQVHRFNFIADPDKTVDGFIAHEAQAVVPECVTGTKDEVDAEGNPVYQGIDQSKLVPLLTAALQEALQKIEDLEGRLTAAGL
jgi:hypothetical protein